MGPTKHLDLLNNRTRTNFCGLSSVFSTFKMTPACLKWSAMSWSEQLGMPPINTRVPFVAGAAALYVLVCGVRKEESMEENECFK